VVPANVADEHLAGVPEPLWLQPYPDRLLDELAATENGPEAAVIAQETIELAFIAAIYHRANGRCSSCVRFLAGRPRTPRRFWKAWARAILETGEWSRQPQIGSQPLLPTSAHEPGLFPAFGLPPTA